MQSNLLEVNKAFDSSIDWKVKIWTLENNAYVTWNHMMVTAWKFNEQAGVKKKEKKKKWTWNKKSKKNEAIESDKTSGEKKEVSSKSNSEASKGKKSGKKGQKKINDEEEVWVKKAELDNEKAEKTLRAPKSQKSNKSQIKEENEEEEEDDTEGN